MHDAALDTDPELVAAAGQAMLLAIENGRLTAELQSTNAELRATRARIVATGDAERRKIERDLHDGAQQHLVALSIRVGLARELADPEAAQRLDDVGKELDEILEELRDLAHGLYPPLLREFGLREALASAVRRSASPAKLEAAAIGRYSEDVEAAVYFCCVEGLQNVDKHAGSGATAVIRLWERDGRLSFEVVDDGVGYDAGIGPPRRSRAGEHVRPDRRDRRDPRRRVDAGTRYHGPGERPGRRRRHAASWSRRPPRLRGSQRLTSSRSHPGASGRRPWSTHNRRSRAGPKSSFRTNAAAPNNSSPDGGSVEALGRDEHDSGSGKCGAEAARRLESVDPGHADVDQHEVGIELPHERERLLPGAGLAQVHEAVGRLDHLPCGLTEHGLVVDRHHPDADPCSPSHE